MLKRLALLVLLLFGVPFFGAVNIWAQGGLKTTSGQSIGATDSSGNVDSLRNKGSWKDYEAKIIYTTLHSDVAHKPDSGLHRFQQYYLPKTFVRPSDLGNFGSSAQNLLFTSGIYGAGLSLGFNTFDLYRTHLDSLRFYNTTNPYSEFAFILGSKSLQMVNLLHTQNISPRWNFAANLSSDNNQGFFSGQTTKGFKGNINTHYVSKNQRYQLKAALVYDHFYQDENGGIRSDSFLRLSNFSERRRIPTNISTISSGLDKSLVNNTLNFFDCFVQNNYSWGKVDTFYNNDSTKRSLKFNPKFRLQYDFQIHNEKHLFNDLRPDSLRYTAIAPISFSSRDTLKMRDNWLYISNKFSLNGFVGKNEKTLKVQAGIGNRIDRFSSLTPPGLIKDNSFNTFLFGKIIKEAYLPHQWAYEANAQLFLTGQALGDFDLNVHLAKPINKYIGFDLGFKQYLAEAPYTFSNFSSNFFQLNNSFGKTGVTQALMGLNSPKLKVTINGSFLLLTNYLYFDENLKPTQNSTAQAVAQIYGSKDFYFRNFYLLNKLTWQQSIGDGSVHVAPIIIDEQLGYQNYLFKKALKVNVGISIFYTSNYYPDAYNPYLNQFYLQSIYRTNNLPQLGAFFNFSLKHFRAFVSLDEIQQLLSTNVINRPGYPAEDMIFRFGFKWLLIN